MAEELMPGKVAIYDLEIRQWRVVDDFVAKALLVDVGHYSDKEPSSETVADGAVAEGSVSPSLPVADGAPTSAQAPDLGSETPQATIPIPEPVVTPVHET